VLQAHKNTSIIGDIRTQEKNKPNLSGIRFNKTTVFVLNVHVSTFELFNSGYNTLPTSMALHAEVTNGLLFCGFLNHMCTSHYVAD
jgi:hypothetical protein